MRILCFGDSNTYGYIPNGSGRFDENVRWTGRLQKELGQEHKIIEEGLCGRTTVFHDDLREGRRGLDLIGTLVESHNPIDVLVVMLGTNDCKTRYGASAGTIAKGIEEVIARAKEKASQEMKVLLVSPIHFGKGVGEEGFDTEFDEKSESTAKQLAKEYEKVAARHGYSFLDASKYAKPSPVDREHLDESGHEKLAQALLGEIEILSGF